VLRLWVARYQILSIKKGAGFREVVIIPFLLFLLACQGLAIILQ
jgi:hypothetical protein